MAVAGADALSLRARVQTKHAARFRRTGYRSGLDSTSLIKATQETNRSYLLLPCAAFLRAAHLAFIASDNFRLPSGVRPPLFLDLLAAVRPPLRLAQRALAAAESLARVAADIERLRPPRRDGRDREPPVPKIVARRFSSV
jgi:hypothetical protein